MTHLESKPDALSYLKERGIYKSTLEKFQIGYAPDSSSVMNFFSRNYFSKAELLDHGVVAVGDDGHMYSRFIERITFPIYSPSGKVVGYGGRTITNHPAKYINSPQSNVFNKSMLLYGYHKAKQEIYKRKEIIVTEGYLDVVMLHQAGFEHAVATLGTALTAEHMPLLRKGEPAVILSYDGDKPGIAAALKASRMLSAGKFKGGVVIFKEGMDPADMVKKGDINALNALFTKPIAFIEFVIEQILLQYDLQNPHDKEKALEESKEYLQTLSEITKAQYVPYVASILGIDTRLVGMNRSLSQENIPHQGNRRMEDIGELSLIKTLISHPDLIDSVIDSIDVSMFKVHGMEFEQLLRAEYESPYLVGLSIRENIKEYSNDELKAQLAFFLVNYYQIKLQQIIRSNMPFDKKNYMVRKVRDNIDRLKRGELVAYEKYDI